MRLIFWAVILSVFALLSYGQAPGQQQSPNPAASGAQRPDQPAGERFKNVQLLKEVPASQFLQSMRNISTSLGVNCEFCHVKGNMASDDKPTKATARKMITMTHAINEQYFGGEMEVHCYTCHKGVSHPVSTPPAGAAPATHPEPGAPAAPAAPPKP